MTLSSGSRGSTRTRRLTRFAVALLLGDGVPGGYTGIAPGARIVNVKVGDGQGDVDVSQIIAGIDWVAEHARSNGLNIRVLNLSLGTNSLQPYEIDPLSR